MIMTGGMERTEYEAVGVNSKVIFLHQLGRNLEHPMLAQPAYRPRLEPIPSE
jgi:hypothetical protein